MRDLVGRLKIVLLAAFRSEVDEELIKILRGGKHIEDRWWRFRQYPSPYEGHMVGLDF